jgi:hypothetical protein
LTKSVQHAIFVYIGGNRLLTQRKPLDEHIEKEKFMSDAQKFWNESVDAVVIILVVNSLIISLGLGGWQMVCATTVLPLLAVGWKRLSRAVTYWETAEQQLKSREEELRASFDQQLFTQARHFLALQRAIDSEENEGAELALKIAEAASAAFVETHRFGKELNIQVLDRGYYFERPGFRFSGPHA